MHDVVNSYNNIFVFVCVCFGCESVQSDICVILFDTNSI